MNKTIEAVPEDTHGEKGFTLIEVMIAMAIFAIGFMAVIGMQFSSVFLNRQSFVISDAARLASDTAEMLMKEPFASDALVDTDGDGEDGLRHAEPDTADHSSVVATHTVYWNIFDDDLNADGTDDFKRINIIVVWQEAPSGAVRRIDYTIARGVNVD